MWTTLPPCARRWHCAVALGLALAGTAARAAPDDPLERLLSERGLVQAPASPAPTVIGGEPVPARTLAQRTRDRASGVVVAAMNFLGVPYRRGGENENGFDCSGFTRHLFDTTLGVLLPRRAEEQAHAPELVAVPRGELEPGDLVFFNTLRRTFSHVGVYVGDGRFIHAPRPGAEVRMENMRVAYWRTRFTGARRPADAAVRPAVVATPMQTTASTLGFPPMY